MPFNVAPFSSLVRAGGAVRRHWKMAAGIGGITALVVVGASAGRLHRTFVQWRSRQFVEQAAVALQAGQWRTAELALTSAVATQPDDPQLRMALGTFYLRNHRPAEGLRWCREAVAAYPAAQAQALLHACAAELILGGHYAELSLLAQQQLVERAPFTSLWLKLAQNGLRMSGRGPSPAMLNPRLDAATTALLRAQSEINVGDAALARATLRKLDDAKLSFAAVNTATQLWLNLGDEPRARAMVRTVNRVLTPDEIRHHESFFFTPSERVALREAQGLAVQTGPLLAHSLAAFMMEHLAHPQPRVATEFTALLRSRERTLSPESLSLLWLYSGLAREPESERIWRGFLEARMSTILPPLENPRLTEPLLRLLISKVPLPFDLVCELMSLTRPTAELPASAPHRQAVAHNR